MGNKKFSKNYPQNMFKTQLDTFRDDFVHFWTFEKFSIFWKHFEDSTLHGTLGKKSLQKNTPKHVQNTFREFGNNFGHFWYFENFSIFWKHFEDSTLHGTLDKICLGKNYPKTCSKHVWTFWERFWAFSECWKFFILKKAFRRLDSPRNNGQ